MSHWKNLPWDLQALHFQGSFDSGLDALQRDALRWPHAEDGRMLLGGYYLPGSRQEVGQMTLMIYKSLIE